jgi:membrane protein
VLLTWLYLSALVLLLGAELNSELEHQTARDTTAGPDQPMGARGAEMADKVAGEAAPIPSPAPAVTAGPLPYGLTIGEALLIILLAVLPGRRPASAE